MKTKMLLSAVALALGACATAPESLPTAPAPVTYDGHVAAQATDIVFMLVPDANPAVPGLALRAGESLLLRLPSAFKRNASVAISTDRDSNLVLTKGWPQGAVRMAGQYAVSYDHASNAMRVTALQDIAASGANAPGIKAIHLRGRSFINPMAGNYPVSVVQMSATGQQLATWQGQVNVLDHAPEARLAPTNFHLAPGANADYQKVSVGQEAPLQLGVLLWGPQGEALNGVGIAPRDIARFPRYTGGLLVQDSNGDKRLDPATDKVIGGIIGAAPQGASGQMARSPVDAEGSPVLSGQTARHAGFPTAVGGGKPNPGLLTIQFKAGSLPGLYRPTVELIGGNSAQFTIEALQP